MDQNSTTDDQPTTQAPKDTVADDADDQGSITVQSRTPQNQVEYQPDKTEEVLPPEPQKVEAPESDHSKIEVQQYDSPVKRPLASLEETLNEKPKDREDESIDDRPDDMFPPLKASSMAEPSSDKTVAIVTPIIILMLAVGFGAGFGGYKLLQKQAASADTTTTSPADTTKTIETSPATSSTSTTATWSSYTNEKYKYTIKFPDTWYSRGTNDPNAITLQFSSFKPDASASTTITDGSKVEIVFQDTNAKTLKDWLDANNASVNAKITSSRSVTVSIKDAIEQTVSAPVHSTATYVIQADKMMVISYYAAEKDFDTGLKIYTDIISSIKFN